MLLSFDMTADGKLTAVYRVILPVTEIVVKNDGDVKKQEGRTTGDIVVSIDLDAVAHVMGRRAVLSKKGQAQDGYVTVRHLRPKRKKSCCHYK